MTGLKRPPRSHSKQKEGGIHVKEDERYQKKKGKKKNNTLEHMPSEGKRGSKNNKG